MNTHESVEYHEGREAYLKGQSKSANPYSILQFTRAQGRESESRYEKWNRGHDETRKAGFQKVIGNNIEEAVELGLLPQPITRAQVDELGYNDEIWWMGGTYDWPRFYKFRVNGKLKTWKTRPDEFKLPIKHGLYHGGYITHENREQFFFGIDPDFLRANAKVLGAAYILKHGPFVTHNQNG